MEYNYANYAKWKEKNPDSNKQEYLYLMKIERLENENKSLKEKLKKNQERYQKELDQLFRKASMCNTYEKELREKEILITVLKSELKKARANPEKTLDETDHVKKAKAQKWYEKFNDRNFSEFYASGKAAAVGAVVRLFNTVGSVAKWIDIPYMENITAAPDRHFTWFIAELFPRINSPEYSDNENENRYATWCTSCSDIKHLKANGHIGKLYLVLCIKQSSPADSSKISFIVKCHKKINKDALKKIRSKSSIINGKIKSSGEISLELFNAI